MKKRTVDNLLGLAVLSVLVERPMHRYEIASTMRARSKDRDMDVKWGSLYTVVGNLTKAGFVEVIGSERAGARPERTIYAITENGRVELSDWARQLIAEPVPGGRRFTAGLSVLAALTPEETIILLDQRADALRQLITSTETELTQLATTALPRLFIVEAEYELAMSTAELAWVQTLRDELANGSFPDLELWRRIRTEALGADQTIATSKGRSMPKS